MLTAYYQKNKERLSKRLVKGIKIFLKKKNTKGANMVVSSIEIFLKKKTKRSMNNIKIFYWMKNKGWLSI